MGSSTSHPVIYSEDAAKISSRRNQHAHSTKKQPSEAKQPNLLQQAIEAASRVRHPAFLDTPSEKTSGVRYPTFPSKLPKLRGQATQFSSTRHQPATVLTEKFSGAEPIKVSASSGPAYVMGTRI